MGVSGYWSNRRDFNYYREVLRLARVHAPEGRTALDVGARDTAVLRSLDWFTHRVALDIQPYPARRGIERVVADFRTYRVPRSFDLVLCLQVLEHLEEPEAFTRKLLESGRTVIVSVPYRWPEGTGPGHVQDPVDEVKLVGWAGRTPVETCIVRDELDRLIAVFRE